MIIEQLSRWEAFCISLIGMLDVPFELVDVLSVDGSNGALWIELKNGKVYSLTIQEHI